MNPNERFEVRLTPAQAGQVRADMLRQGISSKADYVRDCLLAGRAGDARELSINLGLIGMALNEQKRLFMDPPADSLLLEQRIGLCRVAADLVRLMAAVQTFIAMERI